MGQFSRGFTISGTWGKKDVWVLRGFVFMAWGEQSSLVLPLGFHGPLCMHCSAAVWYFSLLAAAAALGASASLILLPLVGNFAPLQLHASTTLKNVRASRSLLRQVFFEGPGGSFFRVFFLHRFLMVFCSILEGLGELYGSQNGGNIDAKLC